MKLVIGFEVCFGNKVYKLIAKNSIIVVMIQCTVARALETNQELRPTLYEHR